MITKRYVTKVVGVTWADRQAAIAALTPDDVLKVGPEPVNEHDPNALAAEIAPKLCGSIIDAQIVRLTGGTEAFPTRGLIVAFDVPDEAI